jgi:hypothetical protein
MSRLVLRYTRGGKAPAKDLAAIRAIPGLKVLDDSGRMLLVESPPEPVLTALAGRPWAIAPERSYARPAATAPGPASGSAARRRRNT